MQHPPGGLGQGSPGLSQLIDLATGETTVGEIARQQVAGIAPDPWKIGVGGIIAITITGIVLGFTGYIGWKAAEKVFG